MASQQSPPQQVQAQPRVRLTDEQKVEVRKLYNIYQNWADNLSLYAEDDLKLMLYVLLQEIVASETMDLEERVDAIEKKLGIVVGEEGEDEEGDNDEEGEEDDG